MIVISTANVDDVAKIQAIAQTTWPVAYGKILSKAQLDYMLDKFYADELLSSAIINKEQHFILAYENEVCLGFASFEHNYCNRNVTRIHKLYILPNIQRKGIGKRLVDAVSKFAQENQSTTLSLNVNRFNTAVSFYKKIGFAIVFEEDIEIGNGYLMEDYRMEMKL